MSRPEPETRGASTTGAMIFAVLIALSGCDAADRSSADYDNVGATASSDVRTDETGEAEGWGMTDEPEELVAASGDMSGNRMTDSANVGEMTASADIQPVADSGVSGRLSFSEKDGSLQIKGKLTGLKPGEHGLHVHTVGDCSAPRSGSAGDHFAPENSDHGSPQSAESDHHAGDLGNISADNDGVANVDATDDELTLTVADSSIVDRAVIIHSGPDDLTSQPSGDSGAPVACGVVRSSTGASVEPGIENDTAR